ncbi:MAG: hypothetical protein ACFCVE_11740 [Phycisphaerae bacterium]
MPLQLFAVARNAFIESIRQHFFVVWLLFVGLLLSLTPWLSGYTFDNDNLLANDMSLWMILLGGSILAAFTAAGVVHREIENKTVLTVVSKPIARPVFIVGKYVGVAAALTLAMVFWSLVLLMWVRHGVLSAATLKPDGPVWVFGSAALLAAAVIASAGNYFFKRHFGSMMSTWGTGLLALAYLLVLLVGKTWELQSPLTDLPVQILAAMVGLMLAVWLFAAVAVASSTRLGTVPTLVVCLVVYFAGFLSDSTLGRWAGDSGTAEAFYRVVPNLKFLHLGDALLQEHNITGGYLGLVTLYTACLVAACLALAVAMFQTRQAG